MNVSPFQTGGTKLPSTYTSRKIVALCVITIRKIVDSCQIKAAGGVYQKDENLAAHQSAEEEGGASPVAQVEGPL
jgi:hypothetical protein